MKKTTFLALFLLGFPSLHAQIGFEENVVDEHDHPYYTSMNLITADIDDDGDEDLIPTASPLSWYENIDGQGNFGSVNIIDVDENEYIDDILISDMDGDGDLDIVYVGFYDGGEEEDWDMWNEIAWYENVDGTFENKHIVYTGTENFINISVADIDQDGDMDLVSSSADGNIAFYENIDGDNTFGSQQIIYNVELWTGDYFLFKLADVDGDGDFDIVTEEYNFLGGNNNNLIWIENLDGLGGFNADAVVIYEDITILNNLKFADFDGDNDLDILLVTGPVNYTSYWLENINGQGEFELGSYFSTDEPSFGWLTSITDVDDDGDLDVLTHSNLTSNESVIIWFENTDGEGTFAEPQTARTVYFNNMGSGCVSDLNGDGFEDILLVRKDGYIISWYENEQGQGTFGEPQGILNDIIGPYSVVSSDVDGDGNKDVLYASQSGDKIAWYKNLGEGSFGEQTIISSAINSARSVSTVDIDNDGDMDVLSASYSDNKIAWYENLDGQGTFGEQQIIDSDSSADYYVIGTDVDGDGDVDVISAGNNTVNWYENTNGQGAFGAAQDVVSEVSGLEEIQVEDLDGDGDTDILLVADSLFWLENTDGQGSFSSHTLAESDIDDAYAADIDNDGNIDIVTASSSLSGIDFGRYENLGVSEGFSEYQLITSIDANYFYIDFKLGDIDADGDLDIVFAKRYFGGDTGVDYGRIYYIKNLGNATGMYGAPALFADHIDDTKSMFVDDVDEDGKADVIVAADHVIYWFKSLGELGNIVSGTVFYDIDGNDCETNGFPVPNALMASGGTGGGSFSTFTETDGTFSMSVPQGNVITGVLAPLQVDSFYSVTPEWHSSSFEGLDEIDDTANFCITSNADIDDLTISVYPLNDPRPGFDTSYEIVYSNIGTTTLTGDLSFEFDDTKIQFLDASETPVLETANMLTFGYTDLLPFETRTITANFNVFEPPVTNIDDVLNTTVTVNPVADDNTPEDNVFELEETVIGAYDPNDIRVLEGEQILLEDAEDYLHYIIRFQNTGTAEAINVRVENPIDDKLDWTTMQLESLSHDGRVEITDGMLAEFIFDNIQLPDSTANEPVSHGHIAYKIKPKDDVEVGDIFYNTASIYFDFNPPIMTNTATTEIVESLSVNVHDLDVVKVFPNPSSFVVNVVSTNPIEAVTITDINGRELHRYKFSATSKSEQIAVNELATGIYFLQITSGNSTFTKKIIKK